MTGLTGVPKMPSLPSGGLPSLPSGGLPSLPSPTGLTGGGLPGPQALAPQQFLTKEDITFDPSKGWTGYPNFAEMFAEHAHVPGIRFQNTEQEFQQRCFTAAGTACYQIIRCIAKQGHFLTF